MIHKKYKFFGANILFLLWIFASVTAESSVFGDGKSSNGVEDNRAPIQGDDDLDFRRYLGVIRCKGVIKGTAIMLSIEPPKNVQAFSEFSFPVLLTAAHVLHGQEESDVNDCRYFPSVDAWDGYRLGPVRAWGVTAQSDQIGDTFSSDWMVVRMNSWEGWRNLSLPFKGDASSAFYSTHNVSQFDRVAMYGYDRASNRLVVADQCHFGYLTSNSLVKDLPALLWDSCDSDRGGSGGVLVGWVNDSPTLLGMRVGGLFDADMYPDGPSHGDPFDITANVNASRIIDQEIIAAIKSLLSK